MNILYKYIFFLILSLGLWSCAKDVQPSSILDIEADLEVFLTQNVGLEGSYPEIEFQTIFPVNCSNAKLDITNTFTNGNKFEINIADVTIEGLCDDTPTYLEEKIPLIKKEAYNVDIKIRSAVLSQSVFQIVNNDYNLKFKSLNGIKYKEIPISIIPKNSCWGRVYSENQAAVNEFTSILDKHNITVSLETGNYGLFSIDNQSANILDASFSALGLDNIEFARKYFDPQSWVDVKSDLLDWSTKYPEVKFAVRNGVGDQIGR